MKPWIVAVVLTLTLAAPTLAGPIVLAGAGWTTDAAFAWWANPSYDGNGQAHVGYFLTGTPGSDVPGFYANSPDLTDLMWLGSGATTFVWDGPVAATTLLSVTAWANVFWIGQGVFYFQSPDNLWRSDQLDRGRSHFALFDSPGAYYLGMEDATWESRRTADWDYNDLVVRIPKTSVPDGGSTLAMLGLALLGLCRCAARREP